MAGGLVLALVAVLAPSTFAADPDYPSADEVERSKEEAGRKADEVGRIEASLAAANTRLEGLNIRVGQLVEKYNGAIVQLEEAQQEAELARKRSETAQRDLEEARRALGRIAAASYRTGGPLASAEMLLSAEGPQAFMDRATDLEQITRHHKRVYDRTRAARVVADVLRGEADKAVAQRERAAAAVRTTKEQAQAAVEEQQNETGRIAAQRTRLIAELAAARKTTVELEQARQRGLAEEAERRAAAAAARRAAAEAAEADAPEGEEQAPRAGAERAIEYARAQLGKAYEWAADGPETFDCSGLTMMAWREGGVELPHWSVAQYTGSTSISQGELSPGDLVFYATDPGDPQTIHHVGLYIGDGEMIHAPRTGDVVKVATIYQMDGPDFLARP